MASLRKHLLKTPQNYSLSFETLTAHFHKHFIITKMFKAPLNACLWLANIGIFSDT